MDIHSLLTSNCKTAPISTASTAPPLPNAGELTRQITDAMDAIKTVPPPEIVCVPDEMVTVHVKEPRRPHKRKRIAKKWAKRYGYKYREEKRAYVLNLDALDCLRLPPLCRMPRGNQIIMARSAVDALRDQT